MLETIMTEVGISLTTFILMLLAAFIASLFHTVSGFAGALIMVISLAPILGIKTVVPVVAVSALINNITRLWVFRRDLVKPIFFSLIVTALPGMVIGAFIFVYLSVQTIALVLGIFMILSVPGRRLLKNRGVQVGRWGFAAIGPAYGVIAGVTMGAGLMLAPFFLGAGLVGSQIVAMTGAIGITLNLTKVVVFGASPLLNFPLFCIGLILGLCAIPAAYAGRWILKRTSIRMHTILVEAVILVGAFFFFSQAFSGFS
jgi:uncharacterized membrane protein YfcA